MIYTIGYAGADLERFIQILTEKNVSLLIDVRSVPKSQYFYRFNDTNLSKELKSVNIKYENWKTEFGARQENPDFFSDGVLDYDRFAQSTQFHVGLSKLQSLIKNGETICLMCAEIDPINCHRAILCGKEISKLRLEVNHIIAKRNGETFFEQQKDFEQRLMQTTKINNLEQAYQKQNKKIGYKLMK